MKRQFLLVLASLVGLSAWASSNICSNAYLWLDASQTNTMTFSGSEITEWRSVNDSGVTAKTYTQSTYPCSGPVITNSLVSFGTTAANRDLDFPQATNIRSVFMVATVEQSGNAFLLGDSTAYDFHRGDAGQFWHTGHSSENIRNGKTYLNGVPITTPTCAKPTDSLALWDVQTAGNVTASQLCYDRAGNKDVPRRGGKDIAELLVFTNELSSAEQAEVRAYLMEKWNVTPQGDENDIGTATVVRAHPRLTAGLTRESLIGIKLTDGTSGALTNLIVRFDLTNCTPEQISDVRVWRQKYDPVPFAFYERDAVELGPKGLVGNREEGTGNRGGFITVSFVATNWADDLTIYPKTGSMSEGDYIWVTAKIADNLATNAEIWTSIEGERVHLTSGDYRLSNQTAKAPHRPFPYKYHIGAYVRQDRLVGDGKTTWDIFSSNTKERFETLTDILPIYSAHDGYSNGKFYVSGWSDGDTASTARIVEFRDKYNPGCMVRPSLVPNNWVTANGIYGLAFEVAGAAESTRKQFAASIVEFLEEQNCDGLDIDYEWVRDGTNHREWQNIGKLLRELSEQFFDHGFVLSFAGRSHDSAQSGMPYNSADYGAFHTCDFIMSQTYGGGWLNSAPCIQRRGLAVCTNRGLPARRVVLGQAAYVSADGHPGWDGASYKVESFTSDPLRRFDIDTWWKSPYTSYWPFEGMSSLQAQCLWVRRENIGGVMSWGYYTDPTWDGWSGFGRHTSKAVWPMPWSWLTPEVKVEGQGQEWHLLKSEEDWFWLYDHPGVKARFENDITLEHDPLVIDTWTGEIDGNGHKLIFAKDTWVISEKATGLIRTLKGTVKNLTVEMNGRVFTVAPRWNDQTADPADVRLKNTMSGENPIGVIAAEAGDSAVIENVTVVMGAGSEVKGVKYAGGLVGKVTGAATITNNTVKVGGKLHLEIRNIWDTLFQPSSPSIGAVVGKVGSSVSSESVIITNNTFTVVEGGEIQDLDKIPDPAYELENDWCEPTGWDMALPMDIDVRSGDWALEVKLELPNYTASTLSSGQYPSIIGLKGKDTTVTLSASGDGGGELFLTGSSTASYAYPLSRAAIRGNGDVGSGVALAVTNADRTVTLQIENRAGELRILQNGATILVTDKNNASSGYLTKALIGAGMAQLGGGRVVSVRLKRERANAIIHPEGYGKLIFDDEFDGDTINSNNWEKVPDNNRGIDWKKYTSSREDLYAVSNGCLVLTGAKNDNKDPSDTRKYQCGQVQSNGKFSFKYGLIEIRAKFTNQDGAWPAMWMMPQHAVHGGWPQSGEIDISERLNSDAYTYQTAHFGATDTTAGTTATIRNGEFNIYGLEWTEDKITWYINGVATHSYSNDGSGYLKWPFDSDFYLILSEQLEGSWVGTVDDESTLPARMYIDYVRVWQRDEDPRKNACLWLDAANTNTMTLVGRAAPAAADEQEVVEWVSDTLTGEKASKYELSSQSPNGPTLIPFSTSTSNLNLVSFGSTSNNCDLAFNRLTDLRTIFMVAKVEESANAFLLGDSTAYNFHRGENGEWWSAGNASKNITGGRTVWNGETVESPTSDVMPSELGLIEVYATNGVAASQLCYDRKGNGSTPRRGGKDVAELVLFKETPSYTEKMKLRKTLTDKWGLTHSNWTITDDWVLRRTDDFSGGISVGKAFQDGAGTYEFAKLKLTGGLQSSSYTMRVQDGDTITLSGDTLNGRCCLGFDVRGGTVAFPEVSGTWYEHTTFSQTGGTVKSLATSTSQSGTGDGFMLGFNGKTMVLDILGGTFQVPNSSLNFYDTVTLNISNATVRAKGIFRSSSKPATVNVNAGGRLEIGSLGIKASTCALNMKGGTLAAFEDGAAVHDNINLLADSTVEVPSGVTLTLDGNLYGDAKLSFTGAGKLKIVAAVTAESIQSHSATAVVRVPDNFPTAQCEIYLSCAEYYAKPQKAESFEVRGGVLYATPPLPDVRASAYLWLDASLTNTMTFSGTEITEWRSVNADGVPAKKYTPSGPTLSAVGGATALPIVSFGSTTANRDLNFTQTTKIRTVFMVAKIEQSKNAFLLGDVTAYHFHRGNDNQYFHSWNSSEYIRNGKTYWNGTLVESPTTTTMPNTLGLITLETTDGVTASQLCYDRNGGDPRRGGKDIAELLIFEKTLTTEERQSIETYLMSKWGLSDCQSFVVTGTPAIYSPATSNQNLTVYGTATTNGTLAILNTFVGGAKVTLEEVPDVKNLDLVFTMATDLTLPGGGTASLTIPSGCSVTIGDGGYAGTIGAADATSKVRYEGTTAIDWPFADNTAFAGVIEIACPLSTAERQYLFGNKNVVFDTGSVLTVEGLNLGNQGNVTQTLTVRGGAITATGSVAPTSTSGSLILAHWPSYVNLNIESGSFVATNAATMLGWDGHAYLTISGGEMSVKGLLANRVALSDNTSSVTLSGGELILGEDGVDFTGRGDYNASFTLSGGILSCREDAAIKVEKGLVVTDASILAAASNTTLSVVAPLSGSGDLTLDAPGGTIALYDISQYKGTITTVTDGTALYLEVKRTAEEISARTPFEVVTLPDNVSSAQCTVKIVNANTGRKVASSLVIVGGVLYATPEMTDKHLTYTPRAEVDAFTWDGAEGAFDGDTFSDFDHVTFNRVVSSNGVDFATLVTIPEETWAGDVHLGGTLSFVGETLHAKSVTMTNACVDIQSLVADEVLVDTNVTLLASGTWNAPLTTSYDTTIEAVNGDALTLASTNITFAEGGVFNLSNYVVRTVGKHYIVQGAAENWPTSSAFQVVGTLPLYKDDDGYFTEKLVNVVVTNGAELVTTDEVYDNLIIEQGGTLIYRGTKMTVVDTVTFAEGATMALYNADGSKIEYVSGISYNLLTAKTITSTPANAQDFTFSIVSNSDGTKTLKATRNLGSARVIRAHPLLTRGVGKESLIGLDFSGAWGGNVKSLKFRCRFENMTADDIGSFKLWHMSYEKVPYAFYEPNATDVTSSFTVKSETSEGGKVLTLTFTATGNGQWIMPEVGSRDCSDRLWLTGELKNLGTLPDNAQFYTDLLTEYYYLANGSFKVENGIAAAPHRLYPWRYLVTAYMRRDRINANTIGTLQNAPEMRWPSLTHVIVSSFNVQYNWGTDAMQIYWDNNASGAFKRLKEYRDTYHPECRLVPSLTKGGYVSLDSRQTGTAESRYAIAHAGEKKYRAKFVKYLVAKMEEMGADGLDIDWEYPDDNSGKDYNAYGLLMRDLAEAFFDHGWDLSMCSNLGYRMPGGEVMAAADYMSSMAYGANRGLHAMNTTSTTAIDVLTSRNVPRRRIVVGQAIYSTAKWHMGWDELAGRCGNDDDIINESWSYNGNSGSFIGFTGPTTYRAKANRVKGVYSDGVEYGGIMSWGYYTDTGWWGGKSLGWNQRQTIWPRPYNFPTPEQDADGTYVITNETGWCWFSENAASVAKVRLAADITFDHDPKPIKSFSGVFDGGNHKLTIPSGIWVVAFEKVGLFQSLTGTIKNLTLDVSGRFICRNDRRNDVQSGWTLSAHGGDGASTAALVAVAGAGARIENVYLLLRKGSEVRGNDEVGALVGEVWSPGAAVVISGCTVECFGTVWSKAVDSVNTVITTGDVGNGRVGLLVGSLNFNSSSSGVTLQNCSATLRSGGVLASVCGNYRTLGGLVGNLHVGAGNSKFVWSGLSMTYYEGASVSGPANTSGYPCRCQQFFGYTFGQSGSTKPALGTANALTFCGASPSGFDSSLWLTGTPSYMGATDSGTAPVVLSSAVTNAVDNLGVMTVSALVDVPSGASGDVILAQCTGGYQFWANVSASGSMLSLTLGYTSSGTRTSCGEVARLVPGVHEFTLALSQSTGTTLYVDGNAVTTQSGYKFSGNPFIEARIGFANVGLYAYDVVQGVTCSVRYPKKATYEAVNLITFGKDDDPLVVSDVVGASDVASATMKAAINTPENVTAGPIADWKVTKDSAKYVVEAYRTDENTTRVKWRNDGSTTRNEAAQTVTSRANTGTKTLNFIHRADDNGTTVYLNAQTAVDSPKTHWSGSVITGASIGFRKGTTLATREFFFGTVQKPDDAHPLDGLAEEPAWYPTMSQTLRDYYRDTIVETLGTYEPPAVTINGKVVTGGESAKVIYLYDGDLYEEQEHTLALDAPIVGGNTVTLGLHGEAPINAALKLMVNDDLTNSWQVAAELPAGSETRSFSLPLDADNGFYQLKADEAVTTKARNNMPIVSTTVSQVNLSEVSAAGQELVVQLEGAGVAEGMTGYIAIDGVAYVAKVDENGEMTFNFSDLSNFSNLSNLQLTLVVPKGAANGDIKVASTTTRALVTEVVADTLKGDGFTEISGFGNYRIPSLVTDGAGEVLCCYDVRYGGGDLGTGDGIDIGETYSSDFGTTFAKPRLAVDVPNTRDEKKVSHGYAKTNDIGDVSMLYDPVTKTYWMMGMTGTGLYQGNYAMNDVVMYTRGKGQGTEWTPWKNPASNSLDPMEYRSIKETIMSQNGITNSTGGKGYGFLEGPGHGFVTTIGREGVMPKGTLVFPTQYFVDSSLTKTTAGAIYSTDHGTNWVATLRSENTDGPQENCVMELDDGSWYMTAKAGYRDGSDPYAETGKLKFFRSTDYRTWTAVGVYAPVPSQQGSCLRLGRNASDGKGRYVLCHTLDRGGGVRAKLALVFGTDTTADDGDTAGIEWDFANPLMLYYDDTGFKGYNSLCMVDSNTLGVLYEAQGHIYFIRIDVSGRLR